MFWYKHNTYVCLILKRSLPPLNRCVLWTQWRRVKWIVKRAHSKIHLSLLGVLVNVWWTGDNAQYIISEHFHSRRNVEGSLDWFTCVTFDFFFSKWNNKKPVQKDFDTYKGNHIGFSTLRCIISGTLCKVNWSDECRMNKNVQFTKKWQQRKPTLISIPF